MDDEMGQCKNTTRDESLLKLHFPRLKTNDNESNTEDEEIPDDLIAMSTDKDIIYLYRLQEALDTLSRFRLDLENAINDTAHTRVKVCFGTEWPVYFERNGQNRRKVNGLINLIQLGSNITSYTIILELYNFKDQPHHIRAIAQKLKAIFSLNVSCFTGCNQKSDYTMMMNQYKEFTFPKEAYQKMDDVSMMAINRGLTSREKGRATLQALCRDRGGA